MCVGRFSGSLMAWLAIVSATAVAAEKVAPPAGWTTASVRDEVTPDFHYDPQGGHDGQGVLIAASDSREGLNGWWQKPIPVQGGPWYRFQAHRKVDGSGVARRTGVARILWQDEKGQPVTHDEPSDASYLPGVRPRAEPEYPFDRDTDAGGWTLVADDYRAPSAAKQ